MNIELIYNLLINPSKAISVISQDKKQTKYILFLIIIGLFSILSSAIGDFVALSMPASVSETFFSFSFVPDILIFYLIVLLLSSIWFFAIKISSNSEELKKQKENSKLPAIFYMLLIISFFPAMFLPATALFSRAFGSNSASIYFLLKFVIFIWIVSLHIISIKSLFKINTFKAIMVYIVPIVGFVFLVSLVIYTIGMSVFLMLVL